VAIQHALLGLLAEGPKHGCELKTAFDEAIGGGDSTGVKGRRIDFGGKMAYNGGQRFETKAGLAP
jgi:hypothetical protein